MDDETTHDLIAAYALDALDRDDERAFERHLETCERCRRELVELRDTAGALALAVDAPAPPASLRQRILDGARGEPTNVVPLRMRRPFQAVTAAAAIAACAAIALGVWATSLARELAEERTAADALEVLADPGAQRISVLAGQATVVVAESRRAALVVRDLAPPPAGKDYEVWVIDDGRPARAGVFEPGDRDAIALGEAVPPGAVVAVTLERDGGVDAPEGPQVFATPPL